MRLPVTLVTLTKFVALTRTGRLVLLEVVRYPISHRSRTSRSSISPYQMAIAGCVLGPVGYAMDLPVGCAMNETLSTRLRLQREEQQIPLATIAEQTKIKLSLLEGLERDDVSRWPTGIFRRSYFRAYVRAIGLESDRIMGEFQALYPDPDAVEDATKVLAQSHHLNGQHRRPPTRLRCLIDSAVSALPAHLQPPFKNAASGLKDSEASTCRGAPSPS